MSEYYANWFSLLKEYIKLVFFISFYKIIQIKLTLVYHYLEYVEKYLDFSFYFVVLNWIDIEPWLRINGRRGIK